MSNLTYEERVTAREQEEISSREALANFTRDIILAELGVCKAYANAVYIYKYGLTADDVVEMVILANKYNMKGALEIGNNAPSGGVSIDVLFSYSRSRE